MKRFFALSLAVLFVIHTSTMIVKSRQRWEDNAENLIRTLTPDALLASCGPAVRDVVSTTTINNRKMFYPISNDKSIGMIFTFLPKSDGAGWYYSASHLGIAQGNELTETEDLNGSHTWAIIELPCLQAKR